MTGINLMLQIKRVNAQLPNEKLEEGSLKPEVSLKEITFDFRLPASDFFLSFVPK
ncbi:MAG: hypothetical protein Roseis2KO_34670 [Roseivirga sp.]